MFIPADLEPGKIVTTAVYGGNVVAIDGNYDDVNRLCAELAGTYPWAFVNVNVRPYYAEGSKTLAFETAEQLGWEAPDHVVVPIASGSLLTKIRKGFDELHKVGLLDDEPEGAGVGRAGARAARRSRPRWLDGVDTIKPVKPDTIAKSLAIGNPADGYFALDAVRQTGGGLAAVTDDEIVDGMRLLARTEGIFAETAGGVTIATLKRLAAEGVVRPDERVVAYITGHGLKTLDAGRPHASARPRRSRPDARRVPRRRSRADSDRRRSSQHGRHRPHPHPAARALRRRGRGQRRRRAPSPRCSATLDAAHPGFAERLFDDGGKLRRFVNVFVADEDIRFLDGLDTPVADGQTVSIVPAVAGGS